MSAIVGERDTLLQVTAERFSTTADGKAILMSASTPVFRVNSAGAGAPGSIAITAKPVNVVGDIVFSVSAGTALRVNGNVATVDFASMTTDTALVQARIREFGVDYLANYMVSKVFDGAAGETGLAGLNTGQAFAYKRAAAAPADSPGDVIFTFSTGAITTPAGNDLANGWSKNIPAGTAPLYVRVAAASSRNATDNIAANEWAGAVQLAKDGTDGLNVAPVRIYQRGATNIAPALPSTACTFTFATGALTGLNNGWSAQVPAAGGAYLFTSGATAASRTATDDIAPGEWAAVARLAADGATGQRGTVTVTAPGYSAWSDASAVYELGRAGYGAPINRDVVTLYDATHAVTKYFENGAWLVLGTVLNGNLLVEGSVAAKALSVDKVSAISANLGEVTAGDIYGATLHGGAGYPTNTYLWPSNGGLGFHLSERGLLLGNPATGGYVELGSGGYVSMPGLLINGGKATFSGRLSAASGTFSGELQAASGIFTGELKGASGTFSGDLSSARVSVGTAAAATSFFEPGYPSISLQSSASGVFIQDSSTSSAVVFTSEEVLFMHNAPLWPAERRIRSGAVFFSIICTAVVDDQLSIWYRTNGGVWVWLSGVQERQAGDAPVATGYGKTLYVSAGDTVQFGVSATNASLTAADMRRLYLKQCQATVIARNF
ncbi:hypothetical protein [Janthinobacterium sp. NKUCC08_JDC]|uniref:hypothetical protein n=1 Tax=Janthinobacterium sp. NKUCC08_JDC TaxID=2842122 RepID=UPI001C5A6F23|nr:hypothetical protein [Janthinobacterium sp. NKUCC08_JDC]MBW3497009.1 hypothetical protein [Janthinobacterium sp. NKUCC08_JDC]